ncbi:SVM family protein [Candidatus Phytoplasma asiaticum]|uniref:SVM family protein n=1 Tax=Candidatus Phytoplasma asiaticum TaxID=2763338 RepID=A0AAX3B9R9_9MOLU|nr:SVM family protein ['Parthenium hysterophorus' phyllody phytoplasma]UQV27432.1 SVM family protein ['Parthenium hysterophorus' phyllody phytoplasma]
MFKLSFKIINICLFVFVGLFLINNKKLYALPGIDLNVRKNQIQAEINSLIIELENVFNDRNIDSSTRLISMVTIREKIDNELNNLSEINRQISRRYIYNLQRNNNQNR